MNHTYKQQIIKLFKLFLLIFFINKMETEEVWYNIMLHSDKIALNKLISYAPMAKKICNGKYFWSAKFKHDNLPIISNPHTCKEWLTEYNKINFALEKAKEETDILISRMEIKEYFHVFWDIDNVSYFKDFLSNSNYFSDDEQQRNIETIMAQEKLTQSIQFSYDYDNHTNTNFSTSSHVYRKKNYAFIYNNAKDISDHNLYNLLFLIYYYYPKQKSLIKKLKQFDDDQ